MNGIVTVLCYLAILVLLAIGFYMLFQSMTLINSARRNMDKIYNHLHEKDKLRAAEMERIRQEYGTTSGKMDGKVSKITSMLIKLDKVLIHSGVGITYRWLNPSTYMVLSVVGFALAVILFTLILKNVALGIILGMIAVIAPYVYMVLQTDKNYRNTEDQLSYFIDMIANNSATTNDIITVMEETAKYSSEPVSGAIGRAIATSNMAGEGQNKTDLFINQLTREIEHPLFIRFVRHLDICSKGDADYRKVAKDFSVQAEEMLASMERQRAIFENGRNEIILMIVLGVVATAMSSSNFADASLLELISNMSKDLIGIIVLVVEAILYGATILYVILGSRR